MKEYFLKLLQKISSLKGTPYAIAAGVACGVAVSFTPFVGAHMLIAAFTAWLIGGNIVGSAVGTLAGNPWTFPIIWPAIWETGRHILGGAYLQRKDADFELLFHQLSNALKNFDFSLFFSDVWPILLPMIVGCIPFYAAAWVLSYWGIRRYLEKYKKR